jgi:NtrC-family two-component system response regulator AlgB
MPEPDQSSLRILVVDDELTIRKTLSMSLEIDGHEVVAVSNADDAIDQAARGSFDLAFVDLRLGTSLGLDLIPALLAQSPWMRIVVITAHASIDSAVETMKRGAVDYLTKPFTPTQVRLVIERMMQVRALEQKVAGLEGILGTSDTETISDSNSPAMQRIINSARQVAKSNTTILLRGESGTGKGVMARAIHAWSDRATKPFAIVSCPTLSSQLLESELFGHAKGAFTGAIRDNPGRIAACEGGTLFLDEIGDLPRELQPKLLRFVQDRQYERVGDPVTRRADVRIITATNIDLEAAVKAGAFREDLLYRIKVIQIDLPPLRDRLEDVVPLSERLLAEFRGGRNVVGFTTEALSALSSYGWPGNLRELRNVIERAVILCQVERIGLEHLPSNFTPQEVQVNVGDNVSLDRLEELHIRRVLANTRSLDEAAKVLGIDSATLWRRRKKYGI